MLGEQIYTRTNNIFIFVFDFHTCYLKSKWPPVSGNGLYFFAGTALMLLIMVWQPLLQILSVSLLLRCILLSYVALVNCLNLSMHCSRAAEQA
jgi:hypothetical protein